MQQLPVMAPAHNAHACSALRPSVCPPRHMASRVRASIQVAVPANWESFSWVSSLALGPLAVGNSQIVYMCMGKHASSFA